MSEAAVQVAIEAAARESYGRLLAFLAARAGGDLAGAEDALGEAFLVALQQWPDEGVPAKPEAWLLAVARRRLIDMQRRGWVRQISEEALRGALELARDASDEDDGFPDERLKLLFVCAHPAIDRAARTPLMLQVVLGLDATRIASAFLVSPAAMAQRLVRVKAKIRAAGIPFEIPGREHLAGRVGEVLDAVYAAYTTGWDESTGGDLAQEALALAGMAARLLPDEPEARGLRALLLHCEARRAARIDATGRYLPLPEQDPKRWDAAKIDEAENELREAARLEAIGRFQLEAAIQSVHARRLRGEGIDWEAIALLYEALVRLTPALGARIGRAIALGRARGAEAGLAALDALEVGRLREHQPYWAARADLLARVGDQERAREAYGRAIGLSESAAAREFLSERRARLG